MTIYDALSQEYGLSVYHDYLLDSNHELLSDMCLNQFIELEQIRVQSVSGSRSVSGSGSVSGSKSVLWPGVGAYSRSYSRSHTKSPAASYSASYSRSVTGSWSE